MRTFHPLLVFSIVLAVGCKDEVACPASKVLVDGECVPRTGTGPLPPETIPGACTPGETRCLEDGREARCLSSGESSTVVACGESAMCLEGACRPVCAPNTKLGCAGPDSERWCLADGLTVTSSPCFAGSVGCYDGECQTTYVCPPGSTTCDQDVLVECDIRGFSETRTPCDDVCDQGACVDACSTVNPELYIGCDFWGVRLDNHVDSLTENFGVTLSNTGRKTARVELSVGLGSPFQVVSVAPGDLEQVALTPEQLPTVPRQGDVIAGLHITSDQPMTVHQFNPINNVDVYSNDASLLLPAAHGGTELMALGWAHPAQEAYLTLIAVESGQTGVLIETPVGLLGPPSIGSIAANQQASFQLEQGQVVSLSTDDPTGVVIRSDKKLSMFTGVVCANIPFSTNYCDHVEQQILPTRVWGRSYVLGKFTPRGQEPDLFRVVAKDDGTVLETHPSVPGLDGVTLQRGEFVEASYDASFFLSASAPVGVGQFMVGSASGCSGAGDLGCDIPRDMACRQSGIGDPAFLMVVPTTSFLTEYTFLTPLDYREDYVNVVAPDTAQVRLDGRALNGGVPIWGSWLLYTESVADGVHQLSADVSVGLFAYGYDCDVSYAYPGGLSLR